MAETTITRPVILDETGKKIVSELSGIRAMMEKDSPLVYGFHINGSESDPYEAVTYLNDAVGMTPAKMDYTTMKFDYGSWANAFFMPRPCMVRQTGDVAYYLDVNDYTKKENGTASDITDTSYAGNAMMEWGRDGKKIWYKIVPDALDPTSGSVYISDQQADSEYHAWSFINNQGTMVDHFYTPIYNGSLIDSTLRSMSGQSVSMSLTGGASGEITAATANNQSSDVLWYIETKSDRTLINLLLVLMGKNLDTQAVFGQGLTSGNEAALTAYRTGTLDDKGLFFGYNDTTHGVKVFGMENWWGAQWRRTAGSIFSNGVYKIKMTYGTQDGSTANGYNTNGNGYIDLSAPTPTGTAGGYIDKMTFTPHGMFPRELNGSDTSYYCDSCWYNAIATCFELVGGVSGGKARCGAFFSYLSGGAGSVNWGYGAAVSYKPLA